MKTPQQLQKDFPFLQSGIAYLDNASTTQKPRVVVEAITRYYEEYCANVHRGLYAWSERATEECENVRTRVQHFIGAKYPEEIIFTSGATQSLNMAARMIAPLLHEGDEVILTIAEHHSSIIPWQMVAKEKKCTLRFLELTKDGVIDPNTLPPLLNARSRVLVFTHIANAAGLIVPVKKLSGIGHDHGLLVVVDGAQSVPHLPVNVMELGADMLAFSGHKIYGPTGIGVLYGKKELLEKCEPMTGGGNMIDEVERDHATWAPLPARFEAGTPHVAGIIGLGAALQYIETLGGMLAIAAVEEKLTQYARKRLAELSGVKIYSPSDTNAHTGIFSFTVSGVHPHDVAGMLDTTGVYVRAGHHCAQPLMKFWGVPATTRASIAFYNTENDIDRLIAGIQKAQTMFT